MPEFWIPKYRYELIEWFKRQKPSWQVKRWKMDRLLAVYLNERNKEVTK